MRNRSITENKKLKSLNKKKNSINEIGGYDDHQTYAKHAGGYLGDLKHSYNMMATVLNNLDKLRNDILDDVLRRNVETFLTGVHGSVDKLGKDVIAAEKKHMGNLRGGRPTRREEE